MMSQAPGGRMMRQRRGIMASSPGSTSRTVTATMVAELPDFIPDSTHHGRTCSLAVLRQLLRSDGPKRLNQQEFPHKLPHAKLTQL